jgi:glycosyl transferase, family 25
MQIVYVISLTDSPRRESISKSLSAEGVTFMFEDAVDARLMTPVEVANRSDDQSIRRRYGRSMTAAEVGCSLSHRSVWRRIADSNCGAVVLEDDALLDPSFFEHMLRWRESSLSNVADIVLLGRAKVPRSSARSIAMLEPLQRWVTMDGHRVGFPFKQWTSGAVGYWISASAARRMCSRCTDRVEALADDWPYYRDYLGLQVAELRPYVVWEGFETMPSSLESERRLVTAKRGRLHQAALAPFRVARTIIRWTRIGGRLLTGRTACPALHSTHGTYGAD